MASIFTKIIQGEIPCYKVAESDDCFAFLDINPMTIGHTLVVPKVEVDYLFDLSEDSYIKLQLFAKKVALALDKTIPRQRVGTIVIGTEVPHAHIHLLPFEEEAVFNISRRRLSIEPEQMKDIAKKVSKAFESLSA